jgi:hypothetical protein
MSSEPLYSSGCPTDLTGVDVHLTGPVSFPRLEGQEQIAGPHEAAIRRANPGSVAVDAYWRTAEGDGPLTNLLYELRRIAAEAQARSAAERVAQRAF